MLLDGYIRVSQVAGRSGERFISPVVQREQIELWASANQVVVGEIFEELDESGGRADRPLLMAALERVESHQSDGVIVAKLDRFGRSVVDGLAAIARIEAAGGTFVSVQDGLDLSTPTGKLVLRIMFSMGEWELDRVRANWDAARAQAISRGVYMSAIAPLGYRRGRDGRLRTDAGAAKVIAEVYRRRAEGTGTREVAEFMNATELESWSGRPFTTSSVHSIIRNRAYLGEAHSGPYANPGAHEPIVDAALWQQAQSPPPRTRQTIKALLVGTIRCASCGRIMTATRPESHGSRCDIYRCRGMAAGGPCPAPAAARADEVEPLIEELVLSLARRQRSTESDLAVDRAAEAVAAAESDLTRYRDNPRLLRTLGPASFEAGLAVRVRAVEAALLELARGRKALRRPRLGFAELERDWSGFDLVQRHGVVAEYLDCVVVERGERPLIERAWVCRYGQGPPSLQPGQEPQPFDRARVKTSRLRAPAHWSQGRIERELTTFLGTRKEWPEYGDFALAGCALLHAQMMAWGGPYFWAHRLDREIAPKAVIWNAIRVGGALAPFLQGRQSWPRQIEFEAAGLRALYVAIPHHGGVTHWAKRFGLTHPDRRRKWSKQRVERELGEFLRSRGEGYRFPTKTEFEAAGRTWLHRAVRGHGGQLYWAEQFGLDPPQRRAKTA